VVVYATCSLQAAQNEDVVAAVIAELSEPAAASVRGWTVVVDPITSLTYRSHSVPVAVHITAEREETEEAAGVAPPAPFTPFLAGGIPGTLRFDPAHSECGGMFVARLVKLPWTGAGEAPSSAVT